MKEISDNQLAAFLDGNCNTEETQQTLNAIQEDNSLQEVARLLAEIDDFLAVPKVLPMTAMAAGDTDRNRCAMLCELYILHQYGVERSEAEWEKQATRQGWLTTDGMALFNIGRLLEQECFSTSRSYHNTVHDIEEALKRNENVVVVVDKNKLETVNSVSDKGIQDEASPNHAVVVLSVDQESVKCYDPAKEKGILQPINTFEQAWCASDSYMVTVRKRDFSTYRPHPIDLSDVELPDDIEDLREAIAENAHEVWAEARQAEGWTYGSERNDKLKQTPDMVPYSDLTDSEREYDRQMAMNTIKLLRKLGYDVVKRK